ncbi:DNA topoisomerase IV subunit A [Pedosphaera parvula]|uniref:DNA topoisomerase (ATP-hydrolyzing) n=1 Tax=Pedosphaera parvula (strain Ellin514) TaxID=320771 RepID=B9XEN7_PEDPL|nr:DNA topoisomerase IV subunit A [Pedosphaera parvula]EEF61751.1 DNA topoisomerase (ATP-hydrolyzing) [Pedosphaera parvula Ellin514]
MSESKKEKKEQPAQPELPTNGNGDGKDNGNGNGKDHVVAETAATEIAVRPFDINKVETPLHKRMDFSFLEYASYVIRDRAIPNLADGLKPVQRRILWSLHEKDDGRFIKVATISGHCAQYHPHGEAAIGDALVVITNKRYLIEGQGNFGNIYTGDPAAAPRYIECRLTELARNELFNDELTEFVPSYDGRNKEPVTLPSKLPTLLMLGTEGIAVGMSCKILPHNFPELLEAQIAILKKQPFKVLPDFPTGGLMDAREYADGKGSIKVRAKIKAKDESTVVIKEIPPMTTTDSLIGSIEDASRKGKIKIKSINDFTSEEAEIEIKAPSGVSADQLIDALYAFTDCEMSISSRIIVIRNNRPVEMTVSEVLRENTAQLVDTLKRELELKEKKLQEELHFKTLVRIFIENRIYKKIEQCKTNEAVYEAVYDGFKPFRKEMIRDLVDTDVEMLLGVRIRRISLFDINKHREEIDKIKADLSETAKHLKNLTKYAIGRLEALLEKYGPIYPRLTKSSRYDEVEAKDVAFKAFKVAYDRESGYVGHKVSGEEFRVDCTKFDKLLLIFRDGHYKVTELQEKLFVGPDVVYCGIPDRDRIFTLAYTNREATYLKRFTFGGIIMNKEYFCIPEKSKILFFEPDTPAQIYIKYKPAAYQKVAQQTANPADVAVKGAKTRGNQISIKDVSAINSKPPRGWDESAPTTKLSFA